MAGPGRAVGREALKGCGLVLCGARRWDKLQGHLPTRRKRLTGPGGGAITPSAFCLGWAEDSSPGQRVGLGLDFEDLQGASQPWRSMGHSFVLAMAMMVIKTNLSSL